MIGPLPWVFPVIDAALRATTFTVLAADQQATATVPAWFTIAVAVGGPLVALLGVLIGHRVARRGAEELDDRAKREELLRCVRWAAELAVDHQQPRAPDLGIATLNALSGLPLLQTPEDRAFIKAVLDAVVQEPADRYRELEPGRNIEVEVAGGGGSGGA